MYIIKNINTGKFWANRGNWWYRPESCWKDKPRVYASLPAALSSFHRIPKYYNNLFEKLWANNDEDLVQFVIKYIENHKGQGIAEINSIDTTKSINLVDLFNDKDSKKWTRNHIWHNWWDKYRKSNKINSIEIAKKFKEEGYHFKSINIS